MLGLVATEAVQRPIEEVETGICTLAGQIAAATARYLIVLAEFDERRGWAGWQCRSAAHWLSWKAGVDLHTAREQVRVARALVGLPKIRDAFSQGRISYSKVRAVTRVADSKKEDDLLRLALEAPAAHIERLCRGLAVAMRPTKNNVDAEQSFRGRWYWDDDGSLVMTARFRPEDGKRVLAALTRAEYERTRTEGIVDSDAAAPAPKNVVPALVSMADMVCDGLESPVTSPSAEVIVHVGDGGDTYLDDGPGLEAESLAEVMCSATMRVIRHGALGSTISWSRTARTPSRSQQRALLMRDRCCAVPGCGRTRFLHAHHVTFHSRGGATDLENLVMLCGEHHRALHDGYFSIRALGCERFSFHHPSGAQVEYAPVVTGTVGDLREAYKSIAPDAIVPDWQGEGLNLSYATDVLIRNWEQAA